MSHVDWQLPEPPARIRTIGLLHLVTPAYERPEVWPSPSWSAG